MLMKKLLLLFTLCLMGLLPVHAQTDYNVFELTYWPNASIETQNKVYNWSIAFYAIVDPTADQWVTSQQIELDFYTGSPTAIAGQYDKDLISSYGTTWVKGDEAAAKIIDAEFTLTFIKSETSALDSHPKLTYTINGIVKDDKEREFALNNITFTVQAAQAIYDQTEKKYKYYYYDLIDETRTAINDVTEDYLFDPAAPMYNVLGQPVGQDFRGIVIQNGHKFLR